jgi:hypothetical protein
VGVTNVDQLNISSRFLKEGYDTPCVTLLSEKLPSVIYGT